ncbi:GNAT family N-acetyltransferase [Paucisalibacillus sp. EB02]|uniref:GNAT family N-acetyltransferase n=1 Tax=Paucisalibacillus sp. EB02 TaxID=1347087 RepID=UPI000693C43F|nr:GNAT family N-acetyltransferase [Paucisalibacillus sp. EB02]
MWITPLLHTQYVTNTVVGVAAVEYIPEYDAEDKHWIPRFMIGEQFQGKGYGMVAMEALIDMFSKQDDCERIRLSVVPENKGAIDLYKKVGFLMTEETLEDELVMEYLVK